jgi:secreted trypsin-like serine protease
MALFGCALAAPPADGNCGVPAIAPSEGNRMEDGRIVGGKEATPYSWPWQIQIRYNNGHFCGGSLLSTNWVLSAAHCFRGYPVSSFSFRGGRHTKTGTSEPYEQTSAAAAVVIHESYSTSTLNNDVAVIRLSTPFTFTRQVSAVCLPTQTTELNSGELVHITGWGAVENTCCSTVLKQVQVPIISRSRCNQADYYNGAITNNMICAGLDQGGLDSCQGDSGGPLVIKKNNKWEQFGIVSWGSGCADPKKPGVYSNVLTLEAWIRSKVTQVEREEAEVSAKFRPAPFGAAFREVARDMVEKGEMSKEDLPLNGEWLDEVAPKIKPVPYGAAFREAARDLVEKGEMTKEDLPANGVWLD